MSKEQTTVIKEIVIGVLMIATVTWGCFYFCEYKTLRGSRAFNYAASALVVMGFWQMVFILIRARERFFIESEIDGSRPKTGSHSDIQDRILRNTSEQLLLAVPVVIALMNKVPGNQILLVLLPVFFSIGRLLFWFGYHKAPVLRGLGFVLTCYPTVFSYLYLIYRLISSFL